MTNRFPIDGYSLWYVCPKCGWIQVVSTISTASVSTVCIHYEPDGIHTIQMRRLEFVEDKK